VKSHSGKRRTPVCLVEATGRQGATLRPSRSRVAELYAFDEQIHSSFYERRTQGATLHPSVASGFMPDVKEKPSPTSCDVTGLTIAGFDEAGRGALAGPVVVACVHFDLGSLLPVASGFMSDVKGLVPNGENCTVGPCLPVPMPVCVRRTGRRQTGARRETSQTSCDATTIHPSSILHTLAGLDDSKRLSPQKREVLYERIYTLAKWGIGWVSHSVIDRRGIVPALTLAAHRAYRAMGQRADLLLFDRGLSLRSGSVPWKPLIDPPLPKELTFTKGDAKSLHIAAASILAKVSRDRAMTRVHARFPDYDFDRNKGYGTASHLATLRRLGPSSIHRRSFRLH